MSSDSIFDKILRKELPSSVVFDDEWVLAIKDITPSAPTHILVIPKKKVLNFADYRHADPNEVGQFFVRVAKVADQLKLTGPGYRVVMNVGKDGGQSVPYLHAHILGGRSLDWPPG